ncbi:MAG: ATP-binding cassette domain-containing protein, partial [Candidatus Bipolaricaulia bacterium]
MGAQMEGSLLELARIGKAIGGRRILRDISFRFERGRRYLLVGANGSGKTTLLKIISSLMR